MGSFIDSKKYYPGHGFLGKEDIPKVVAENRLEPCLVRCGGGRFTCPAQDVQHFVDIITAEGSDYVRDVCLYTRFKKWVGGKG